MPIISLPSTHALLPFAISPATASPLVVSTTLELPATPNMVTVLLILLAARSVSTTLRVVAVYIPAATVSVEIG